MGSWCERYDGFILSTVVYYKKNWPFFTYPYFFPRVTLGLHGLFFGGQLFAEQCLHCSCSLLCIIFAVYNNCICYSRACGIEERMKKDISNDFLSRTRFGFFFESYYKKNTDNCRESMNYEKECFCVNKIKDREKKKGERDDTLCQTLVDHFFSS